MNSIDELILEFSEEFSGIKNEVTEVFDECNNIIDISDQPDIQKLIINNSWVYKPGIAKNLITKLFGYKINVVFKNFIPSYLVRE